MLCHYSSQHSHGIFTRKCNFFLVLFSSSALFWPLTTFAYFVLIKTIQLPKCSARSGHSGYGFSLFNSFLLFIIFTLFHTFFFILELYGSFASNALYSFCSLKPLLTHTLFYRHHSIFKRDRRLNYFSCIHVSAIFRRFWHIQVLVSYLSLALFRFYNGCVLRNPLQARVDDVTQ